MSRTWFSEYSYGDEEELTFYDTDWWSEAMWNEIHERDSEWASTLAEHYDKKIHDFTKQSPYDPSSPELVCEVCELTPEELGIGTAKTDEDIIYS